MATYLAPGVYIKETAADTRPIESPSTSVAAFLGAAPDDKARPNEAFPVNNWAEFERTYCSGAKQSTDLAQAVELFFRNGGSRCYIVNIASGPVAGTKGIDLLRTEDEVSIVAAPGYSDKLSHDALIAHCEQMGDRVCILDLVKDPGDLRALTRPSEGVLPDPKPADPKAEAKPAAPPKIVACGPPSSKYAAAYTPWMYAPNIVDGTRYLVPPSGAVAGIFARTDATRGVHKAPANERIFGIVGLRSSIAKQDQELLNPEGINVIRQSQRLGISVWGCRLTEKVDTSWRYVNVRRFFCMVEKAIERSTQWIVFEPNDQTLWGKITRDCNAYLRLLWRNGALMGATEEQAFFVRCDESLNPPEVREAGQVIIQIGLAVAKPAEFVVFWIGPWDGGGMQVSEKGGA